MSFHTKLFCHLS